MFSNSIKVLIVSILLSITVSAKDSIAITTKDLNSVYFLPKQSSTVKDKLINLIKNSRDSIYIGMYNFTYKKIAKDNVLINNLRIGVTDTKIHKKIKNKNIKKRISLIPIKRMATPLEIAKYIYQLSSTENTFVTGETFTVAGGE